MNTFIKDFLSNNFYIDLKRNIYIRVYIHLRKLIYFIIYISYIYIFSNYCEISLNFYVIDWSLMLILLFL